MVRGKIKEAGEAEKFLTTFGRRAILEASKTKGALPVRPPG